MIPEKYNKIADLNAFDFIQKHEDGIKIDIDNKQIVKEALHRGVCFTSEGWIYDFTYLNISVHKYESGIVKIVIILRTKHDEYHYRTSEMPKQLPDGSFDWNSINVKNYLEFYATDCWQGKEDGETERVFLDISEYIVDKYDYECYDKQDKDVVTILLIPKKLI